MIINIQKIYRIVLCYYTFLHFKRRFFTALKKIKTELNNMTDISNNKTCIIERNGFNQIVKNRTFKKV